MPWATLVVESAYSSTIARLRQPMGVVVEEREIPQTADQTCLNMIATAWYKTSSAAAIGQSVNAGQL